MEAGASTHDFGKDVRGTSGPDEGFRITVVLRDVFVDGVHEFRDIMKDAARQLLFGQITKEAFHHVQPRGTGGREMHMKSRMLSKPGLNLWMLVCRVVIGNQMQYLVLGRGGIDLPQKAQPFLMAMPLHALADYVAIQCVERSKQRGHTIAFVVMGKGLGSPFLQRPTPFRPLYLLDLTLLVAAQNQRMLWRVQIQPHDKIGR